MTANAVYKPSVLLLEEVWLADLSYHIHLSTKNTLSRCIVLYVSMLCMDKIPVVYDTPQICKNLHFDSFKLVEHQFVLKVFFFFNCQYKAFAKGYGLRVD